MVIVTENQAQSGLAALLERVAASHEPVQIAGRTASAVLIAEEDWRSIEETLYLLSIPGMRESIQKGVLTPIEECSPDLSW